MSRRWSVLLERPAARRVLVATVVLALAGCGRAAEFSREEIELNNRGVALMGYFDYPGARDVFARLVEQRPGWSDAEVNLAIATLNRQQEGDERRALDLLAQVMERDPEHLRARYVAGLLRLYLGETEASLDSLRRVVAADETDAYAHYFIAQNLVQAGELEGALAGYEKSIALDPYLRSAYYGAGLVLRRLGRADRAREMLEAYQRFADNPRARLAEFKYTRMGPKAVAVAVGPERPAERSDRPAGALFDTPGNVAVPGIPAATRLTAADTDGDGDLDLYAAGKDGSLLLEADGSGRYVADSDHALSGIPAIAAALWGDVDNDGDLDVYLCRAGPNQLWKSDGSGDWSEVSAATGTDDDRHCADAGLFDADHDGDLDIFLVNADGPDELFSNNMDGSFRRLAESQGIGGGDGGRQVLPVDLDGDRDVDIVVLRATGNDVWLNDRLWQYRSAEGFDDFRSTPVSAAVAGDRDADGRPEIYTVGADGRLAAWSAAAGRWQSETIGQLDGDRPYLALADFDGDGVPDLLGGGGSGAAIFAGDGNRQVVESADGLAGPVLVVNGDAARGPSLAAPIADGLRTWSPGPGRYAFLAVTVTGKEERSESMRSNRSGIGTRLSLRILDRWSIADTFDRHSAPGQSLQPVLFGLGGHASADYLAMDWSDGVFQTELDLAGGRLHRIAETQRQLSSCPVVFAWDGSRYAFVSDILGVGGLGFLVRPGQYANPRPWERFLMPAGLPQERDGRLAVKITEPMEENAYLDAVRLQVVDIPPGWDVVTDERMATGQPDVTGRLIFFSSERYPARAVNDRGEDVTAQVRHADRQAAPPGPLDHRFIGRLDRPHGLTIEFDRAINEPGARPVLVADGWVEYPYSQTVFAAWQSDARYDPPDLDAMTEDGAWHRVHADFGYPAGMPRVMALPLDALPPRTVALRLITNLEVYWDRLRIVYEARPPASRSHHLAPVVARLAKTGFPLRRTGAQRLPDYDYAIRRAFWDARYLEGYYTALGPIDPLLAETDDAVAIIGSGEEIHLEFEAPPPPPDGWSRRIVLDARGWAKDMDMYTRDGGKVGPLPVRRPTGGAPEQRRRDLHDRYNVRFQSGR
jgi:tetratricopeptide (TPR) repeat protein